MKYNGKKLDAVIERVMKMKPGPAGLAVAVSKDGETVYTRYEGYADEAAGRKMDPDTIFDLWSLTKVFVCTAAMTLYEQGAFLLTDPLDYYFPEHRNMFVPDEKLVLNNANHYWLVWAGDLTYDDVMWIEQYGFKAKEIFDDGVLGIYRFSLYMLEYDID